MSRHASPRAILITGATGAIGAALAEEYAAPGITLILHGRNLLRLDAIASVCRSKGAQVLQQDFDLRETDRLFAWVESMAGTYGLDLVIANAGVNIDIGENAQGEVWQDVNALLEINVKAAMATAHAAIACMRRAGHGQIVLMSSLAAYYGLPITPSYCASKAAVKAYGEALRGWLRHAGIRVSVVMPGYVRSEMCDNMPGPKPFLWTAERAAVAIRRGLQRDQARITFPFPLNFGCWWLAVLPAAWSSRILGWLGYGK